MRDADCAGSEGKTIRFALAALGLVSVLGIAAALLLRGDTGPLASVAEPSRIKAMMGAASEAKDIHNMLVYRADRSGHFIVDGVVNGAPVRFLVDTGATVVALTPDDARAAGIGRSDLRFAETVSTAHGEARAARTTLRTVRLNQLAVEDVPAVVMEQPMALSLLGMSFLNRVDGYNVRDGRLTIEW